MSKKVGFDKWDRQLNNWENSEYYYSQDDQNNWLEEEYNEEEDNKYESRKRKRT